MKNRNTAIDLAKWVFAFMVVTLHTSFWHSYLLIPIARCAVPYFYMVTGYFVLNSSEGKIKKASKKWLLMWLKYTLLLLVIGCLWNLYSKSFKVWTVEDTFNLILGGTNIFIDEHTFDGKVYGISTLWFLYAGFWALLVFKFLYRYLFNKFVDAIVLILLFGSVITNYVFGIQYDEAFRALFLAIPFIYMGGRLRRVKKKYFNVKLFGSIIILLWLMGLLEIAYVKDHNMIVQNIYLICIPLSLLLFYTIVNLPLKKGKSIIKYFPVSATLDVYIWHRLVYFILALLNCYIGVIGSIEVFLVTTLVSVTIRRLKNE